MQMSEQRLQLSTARFSLPGGRGRTVLRSASGGTKERERERKKKKPHFWKEKRARFSCAAIPRVHNLLKVGV